MAGPLEIQVPDWLLWLNAEPGGPEWLAGLPAVVAECADRWSLHLDDPYRANVSYVAPATTPPGAAVTLKINFPHQESDLEAAALRHWDGSGAVKLLDEHPEARALLLERCIPGTTLWNEPEESATDVMVEVFIKLWERRPEDPRFHTLAAAADVWSEHVQRAYESSGEPFDRDLLDEALGFMATARGPDPADVLLHQDLHGGNVLRHGDEWAVIDPKPLVGEAAFDLASYLRDRRESFATDPAPEKTVRARIDRLCSGLDVDRERVRGWGVAHSLAWGFDAAGTFYPAHVHAARLIARC